MLNRIALSAVIAIFAMSANAAMAEEYNKVQEKTDDYVKVANMIFERTVKDPIVREECGDCHQVFPPQKLFVNSWKKLMGGLEDHFGDNATLDAESHKHIEDYLVANAYDAKGGFRAKLMIKTLAKKGIVDPIRISDLPGWAHDHKGSAIYDKMVIDTKYDRKANCVVCHVNGEYGLYESFGE